MISLLPTAGELEILCLGAHPDDIEIGCGATLLTLAEARSVRANALVLTGEGERRDEGMKATGAFLPGAAVDVRVVGLPDGRLPAHWGEVKDALEAAGRDIQPDVVFAPRADDAHQDHRLLAELVPTVWRDALVLGYEIPKWDGDLGTATHYVPVSPETAQRKVRLLDECFGSQTGRDWWDEELFLGLLRLRGVECRSRYAEAFTVSKAVLRF
ncbi:LmbE family N-acetylglucosaminyl deacetylase [Haloactinopolyspora alba]|uniref:LmbE family N-acetylglucosaminyl deacetylase n=1 Tax=Haloactinopolyspora alba TaxID=648780 RepID=A0A2P8E5H8_9ACTN|nr:PIG-L deacetylase family protein [Haloactinopolyspora alba]PSL04725.1 LmbE family N-acetylglucosaminyl deacetylase [Haloactinopolyspora alba]